jgi:hypothetical protein
MNSIKNNVVFVITIMDNSWQGIPNSILMDSF